jgi:hypothetical protein
MIYTLTYAGRLPSSGSARTSGVAKTKHDIRRAFHPQLKELWRTHPALADHQHWILRQWTDPAQDSVGALLVGISGNDFATLIHPYLKLYVELEILVLRPEAPGAVISHSGDIDNQLKTLFDALRRPVAVTELPSNWTPGDDEKPLHCLLDDDKLITHVDLEVDRLLKPVTDPKYVELTIRVNVKGFTATWGNMGLIG